MDGRLLGARLRDLRRRRGETLEQVSDATGLSVAMLSRIERGERLPSPDSVEALARHFGLPVDDLLSDTIAARMASSYGRARSGRGVEGLTNLNEIMAALSELPHATRPSESPGSEGIGSLRSSAGTSHGADWGPRSGVYSRAFTPRPIEDLFPRRDFAEHLEDATRVAEVALGSAVAAAERAIRSGDAHLAQQGRAALARLRRMLEKP